MNPSYGNGMPSASGGRPGVISSGPDSASTPPVSMPSTSGRAGSGGPKKGIIIGGILMILTLGLGTAAVVVMMTNRNGDASTETSSSVFPIVVREQFNSFYHYLTDNTPNNTSNISVEDLMRTSFYIDNTNLSVSQRDKFLNAFSEEMAKFVESYGNTNGKQPLDNIYAYIYTLHKIDEITIFELRDIYNSNGVAVAKQKIIDAYQNYDSENSNELLDTYISLEKEYLTAFVDSLESGNEDGLFDKKTEAIQAKDALRSAAYYDLEHLYSEVYDENLNEGTSV